ncbi:MAG: hypothetical protein GC165_09130 [Armatimonadetes bacterium]|nr:hypothetical protein [Armatimonadota bacterium]
MTAALAFFIVVGQAKGKPKTPPAKPKTSVTQKKKATAPKTSSTKVSTTKKTTAAPAKVAAPSNKIVLGSDVDTIARVRPGHYVADRDVRTLPKLHDVSNDQLNVFSGKVYVIPADEKASPQIFNFVGGRQRLFNSEKGTVEVGQSLYDFVHSQDAKSDIRVADPTAANFEVLLPKEAKKLDGFSGTITYFVQDMKPEQSLTLTLKSGKVVGSSRPLS